MLGTLSPMSEPVQWGRSGMGWSREGYILSVTLWVQERALHESHAELERAVEDALAEFEVVLVRTSPMEIKRDSSGTQSDPGELEIVTRRMMTPDAAVPMREAVSKVLRDAIEETDRRAEADDAAAKLVLEALRRSD